METALATPTRPSNSTPGQLLREAAAQRRAAARPRTTTITRPDARRLPVVGPVVAVLALFLLAWAPRVLSLDQHATADEDLTLIRSANVALALERADWWGVYQIGHPEATVQMLVALSLGPDRLRPYAGDFLGPDSRRAAAVPGYFDTLVAARALLTPVHAALVLLAALLCWRLWGAASGAIVGLMLALEPFLVAHGRILRTDALLAELMLAAVLSAVAFGSGRAGGWSLAVSALTTGLALLTKTPALALFGAVPVAACAGLLVGHADDASDDAARKPRPMLRRLIRLIGWLAAWLAGSIAVAFALWPALWARPLRAIERMAVYTQEKGGSPMDAGSFFLGTPIPDPGPLYYALALPLRLSPLAIVGLLLWLLLRAPRLRDGIGVTLLIGLGLAAVLALLPKKADRYILPAIPFLIVTAGVGFAEVCRRWRAVSPGVLAGGVAAVECALLALVWPYPLAAYNPLLGGARTADATISVGWGEGLDQLAPVLNARGDAQFLTVSTPYPEVLQAQIQGRAVDLDQYDIADYAVRYVAASQRHLGGAALEGAIAARAPLAEVEIAGIPYAQLYALDPPSFAGNLEARGLSVEPSIVGRRGWVTVTVALGPPSAEGRRPGPGQTPFVTPLEVEAVLVNAANPRDVEATVTRALLPDGSRAELKLRAPNGLGRYMVGLSVREPGSGTPFAVTSWPVGAPRLPDRLVFPSLSVRVQ
ncbi:MAG: phospholipid carrier-dependent glycosyltransferase [Chloroflexi bacterium]|nr:phospholipid carrier-dependent glycosyltransferase [Chloroflexota bacterium]